MTDSGPAFGRAFRHLFTTHDGIDRSKYVLARYRISAPDGEDVRAASVRMALVASIGTVAPLSSESAKTRSEYGPRILHPDVSSDHAEVTIAFPLALFGTHDALAQVMGVTMFVAEYNYARGIRLEWLDLPRAMLALHSGPRLGVSGLRQLTGVTGRPLLGTIIKPRVGVAMGRIAQDAQDSLIGGADLLLDDELVVDPEGELSFDNRLHSLVAAAERASTQTGTWKGVAMNVTSRPSNALRYATKARDGGAAALIYNAFVGGFPSLQDLRDADPGLPIFACNVGSGLLTRSDSNSGVAGSVFARLSRLAGADAVQSGILGGDAYTTEAWGPSITALDGALPDIKEAMPIVAGGLNIANLWANWSVLGEDVIFAAGSGILGYPSGPRKATEAFRLLLAELDPDASAEAAHQKIVRLSAKRSGADLMKMLRQYGYVAPR